MTAAVSPALKHPGNLTQLHPEGFVCRDGRDLESLHGLWSELQETMHASPMARTEWCQAFIESFARNHSQRVLLASCYSKGSLQAAVPFYRKGILGLGFLELASSGELYEPTDLLYRDTQSLGYILDGVLATFKLPIVLERQPGNSDTLEFITHRLKNAYKVRRRSRPASPSVALGSDPDQVLNSGRRSDLRRMLKRAEKRGEVRFEVVSPTERDLPGLMETAYRIEAAGWKGDNGSALLQDAAAKVFFDRYAVLATHAGIFRMAFMYVDGQAIATQIMIECGSSLWLLKIGFDEAYAECSPGNLLMMEVIRYACRQHLKSCEFLGVAANWTRMWTNTEYATERVTIFPGPWSYLRHMAFLGAQRAAQKIWGKSTTTERAAM